MSEIEPNQVNVPAEPAKITLWGEIVKGWQWVVFSWKTLSRLGGFKEIVQALFSALVLLIRRGLSQSQTNR
ncbi:hypothetical protein TUMEXPCC7403_13440 [Tumidithrix helvetica PCC 7403]|uniref:hypothetical protein n=1 Tax=Tumidithrix helvetica TaxID=3457545 RepID=UPI003C7F3212